MLATNLRLDEMVDEDSRWCGRRPHRQHLYAASLAGGSPPFCCPAQTLSKGDLPEGDSSLYVL